MPWARDPATATREISRLALEHGVRFAIATNGRVLRLVDATRPSARGALDFDLDRCQIDASALTALRALAGASAGPTAHDTSTSILMQAIAASDRAGVQVCQSLRHGVRDALGSIREAIERATSRPSGSRARAARHDEALTAVYRILFLLFAEARRLVPIWHPVYRDGYTLAALRSRLETRANVRGTWAALQAMARLAHAGCEIGDLRVAAFNGRLFAPAHAPLLDHLRLDDRAVSAALASLVFVEQGPGRAPARGIRGSRRRAAGVHLRALTGRRTRRPRTRGAVATKGHRQLLHAGGRSPTISSASPWILSFAAEPSTKSSRSASSIRRWAAARSSWRRADTSRWRASVHISRPEGPNATTTCARRGGGGRRSDACSVWMRIRWPCSSRSCRCGSRRWRPGGRCRSSIITCCAATA